MKADSTRAIIAGLNAAGARYLIVGGLAVVAHGYVRYTVAIDLVVGLDADNARRSMQALACLGYKPRVPVRIEDFADPGLRAIWVRDKGMVVFQLVSDTHPETSVDVFVTEPFDFAVQYQRACRYAVLGGEEAPVIALDELLIMKRQVSRPKDLVDVDELSRMHNLSLE